MTQSQKLKFCIMCNGDYLLDWQLKCIESLNTLDYVEPVLLIVNKNAQQKKPSLFKKLTKIFTLNLFFKIYIRIFCKFKSKMIVSIDDHFPNIPKIECKIIRKGKFSEYFSNEDITTIRSYQPDFIIRFAFGIIRGEILEVAKYGVWSYHHGDEQEYRGGPPGFWEIYNNSNITGAILQKLTDKLDKGIVLKKGYYKTVNSSYSKQLDRIYYDSSDWIKQVCIDIKNNNADYFWNKPSSSKAKIFYLPTNWKFLIYIIKLFRNKLRNIFYSEKWNVGIINKPIKEVLFSNTDPQITWFDEHDNSYFIADPFGFVKNGKHYILFEDCNYKTSRGHISISEFTPEKRFSPKKAIIKENYHLSYPYIIEHDGEIYCIPESNEANQVNIYKLHDSPIRFEKESILLDNFAACDSTIFHHEGKWWLFCTNDKNSNEKLFIFYADDLLGTWQPHCGNPVKTDIRCSRPGGSIFIHNGDLYRVAQDSSQTYGGRSVLMKVNKLTTLEFIETPIKVIEPNSGYRFNKGLHTISSVGNYTLVDGKRSFVDRYKIAKKIKRVFRMN